MMTKTEPGGIASPRLLLILALLAAAMAALSCAVTVRAPIHDAEGVVYSEDLIVDEPPPPPRAELTVGVAPGPDYVWVEGYWTRQGGSWFWVHGRWMARPRPQALWVVGRWERHPRGFVWVAGHWR